jgi:hypothetical protein
MPSVPAAESGRAVTSNRGAIEPAFAQMEVRLIVRTTRMRTLKDRPMCNLYYADLWIMPTIGPELSLAAVIAASESA